MSIEKNWLGWIYHNLQQDLIYKHFSNITMPSMYISPPNTYIDPTSYIKKIDWENALFLKPVEEKRNSKYY